MSANTTVNSRLKKAFPRTSTHATACTNGEEGEAPAAPSSANQVSKKSKPKSSSKCCSIKLQCDCSTLNALAIMFLLFVLLVAANFTFVIFRQYGATYRQYDRFQALDDMEVYGWFVQKKFDKQMEEVDYRLDKLQNLIDGVENKKAGETDAHDYDEDNFDAEAGFMTMEFKGVWKDDALRTFPNLMSPHERMAVSGAVMTKQSKSFDVNKFGENMDQIYKKMKIADEKVAYIGLQDGNQGFYHIGDYASMVRAGKDYARVGRKTDDVPNIAWGGRVNQTILVPKCKDCLVTHIGGGWENAVYKITVESFWPVHFFEELQE